MISIMRKDGVMGKIPKEVSPPVVSHQEFRRPLEKIMYIGIVSRVNLVRSVYPG
jgi:hypothetical protein